MFDFQDLSGTFSVTDVAISLALSFVLSSAVGVVYKKTHKNVSYSQSYVHTLVLIAMVLSVIMLVVGSNIARAFALVGALSVVRFRNAIKETRDVGFIFLAMAIGMTCGTRFYVLAIAATIFISAVLYVMFRFDWFKASIRRHLVTVQVPADEPEATAEVENTLAVYCSSFEMVSAEATRGGSVVELTYTAEVNKDVKPTELIAAMATVSRGLKTTVLTGYDQTDV